MPLCASAPCFLLGLALLLHMLLSLILFQEGQSSIVALINVSLVSSIAYVWGKQAGAEEAELHGENNASCNQEKHLLMGIRTLQATVQDACADEESWECKGILRDLILRVLDAIAEGHSPEQQDLSQLHQALQKCPWDFQTSLHLNLDKHSEMEDEIKEAMFHLLGILRTSQMQHGVDSYDNHLPNSLLQEVTPGLLPFNFTCVDATQGAFDNRGSSESAKASQAQLDPAPSLSTMLGSLVCADSPLLDNPNSTDKGFRLQSSLQTAIRRLCSSRRPSRRSVSVSSLSPSTRTSAGNAAPSHWAGPCSTSSNVSAQAASRPPQPATSEATSKPYSCDGPGPGPAVCPAKGAGRIRHTVLFDEGLGAQENLASKAEPAQDALGDATRRIRMRARSSADCLQGMLDSTSTICDSRDSPFGNDTTDCIPLLQPKQGHRSLKLFSSLRERRERDEGWSVTPMIRNAAGQPVAAFWGDSTTELGAGASDNAKDAQGAQDGQEAGCSTAEKGKPPSSDATLSLRSQERSRSSPPLAPAESIVSLDAMDSGSAPKPSPVLVLEVEALLESAYSSFSFDAFQLNTVTQGHPLSTFSYYIFHKSGLIASLNLHAIKLARFLQNVEAGYHLSNPYHNVVHAADVLQTLHVILHNGGLAAQLADPLLLLASYLAAIVHDYDHGGFTNDFLKNSHNALAIRYNDNAPLENHHLAAAFGVLLSPGQGCNFLCNLSLIDYTRLRAAIIALVLATDMKQHFPILGQAKAMLQQLRSREDPASCRSDFSVPRRQSEDRHTRPSAGSAQSHTPFQLVTNLGRSASGFPSRPMLELRKAATSDTSLDVFKAVAQDSAPFGLLARQSKGVEGSSKHNNSRVMSADTSVHGSDSWSPHDRPASNAGTGQHKWDKEGGLVISCLNPEQRLLVLQIALKSADLGHVAEDWDVHHRWVRCLEEEFFRQGDQEKTANLPSSPLFDREKPGVSKSQVGFLEVIALPLFKTLVQAVPGAQPLVTGAERNYEYWKERQKQAQQLEEAGPSC